MDHSSPQQTFGKRWLANLANRWAPLPTHPSICLILDACPVLVSHSMLACMHFPGLNDDAGRNDALVAMDPDTYKSQYEGKNWDVFSAEQSYFQGNTLYLCTY